MTIEDKVCSGARSRNYFGRLLGYTFGSAYDRDLVNWMAAENCPEEQELCEMGAYSGLGRILMVGAAIVVGAHLGVEYSSVEPSLSTGGVPGAILTKIMGGVAGGYAGCVAGFLGSAIISPLAVSAGYYCVDGAKYVKKSVKSCFRKPKKEEVR